MLVSFFQYFRQATVYLTHNLGLLNSFFQHLNCPKTGLPRIESVIQDLLKALLLKFSWLFFRDVRVNLLLYTLCGFFLALFFPHLFHFIPLLHHHHFSSFIFSEPNFAGTKTRNVGDQPRCATCKFGTFFSHDFR